MEQKPVGKWEKFELCLENNVKYRDPFKDAILNVNFKKPNGNNIELIGFYDGRNTWKARCMPDEEGIWMYQAWFSDGSIKVEVQFTCVPSSIPGMIWKYEANPIWFGFKGGDGFQLRSFHVGDRFFASNWSNKDRNVFLDWVQAKGYNTLSVASHYLNRNEKGRGKEWDTPELWKAGIPVTEEYDRMEGILNELQKRKMIIFPFAGFFGRSSNAPCNCEDQKLFINYTLARLGAYWNILLNVGGPEPLHLEKYYMRKQDIDILGKYIKTCDVY